MTIALPAVKVHRVVHHVAANVREDVPAIVIPVVGINVHTNAERIVMVDVQDAIRNAPTVLVHVTCRVPELVVVYVETVHKVWDLHLDAVNVVWAVRLRIVRMHKIHVIRHVPEVVNLRI